MAERIVARLGDLCTIEKGETGIASAVPGEFPLVTTAPARKTSETWQFNAEAVCIPLVSSTGHGKKTLNYVHYQSGKFALGSILAAVIPNNPGQLSAAYIHRYLQFHKNSKLVSLMKGAANVSLAVRDIAKVEIELPSIEDQNRFVLIYDEAERFARQLEDEYEIQERTIQSLRSSLLQEAIEGRLSAEWRATHPFKKGDPERDGEALLEAIREEKKKLVAAGKIRKEKPLAPIGKGEESFGLPEGWVWTRLGDVGSFGRGKSKHRPRNDPGLFAGGTIPFVQTGEVSQSKWNSYRIEKAERFYNEKGLQQSKIWPKETLCITIAANIAETGFLQMDACFPDSVVGFISLTGNSTPWLIRYFLAAAQDEIIKFAPATAQKNINLEIIGDLIFPLPPLAEQAFIVERVEVLLARVGELEKEVAARRALTEELMREVLREAFE
ncbi:MAG TPA: restriction endonuclease subunit S [Spirochaetia bacterium]|nr:restriction endonuclease subunit S [Spirochaetia bacterium]